MKVLVTGGGGFIGSWIVSRLINAGASVRIFARRNDRRLVELIVANEAVNKIEWVIGDIANTSLVSEAAKDCTAIINLAGLLTPACQSNPVLGANVNFIGSLNVFLAACKHKINKVIYMSSAGVFGPDSGNKPDPATLYGVFKLAAEYSAQVFYATERISSIGFRPYVVYGPGRNVGLSAGPTLACRAVAKGDTYTIPFTGEFDIIHVDDVADACLRALDVYSEGAHIVNLLGGKVNVNQVIDAIKTVAPDAKIRAEGSPLPIQAPLEEPLVKVLLSDWKSRPLVQGIAETIEFYRNLREK